MQLLRNNDVINFQTILSFSGDNSFSLDEFYFRKLNTTIFTWKLDESPLYKYE